MSHCREQCHHIYEASFALQSTSADSGPFARVPLRPGLPCSLNMWCIKGLFFQIRVLKEHLPALSLARKVHAFVQVPGDIVPSSFLRTKNREQAEPRRAGVLLQIPNKVFEPGLNSKGSDDQGSTPVGILPPSLMGQGPLLTALCGHSEYCFFSLNICT